MVLGDEAAFEDDREGVYGRRFRARSRTTGKAAAMDLHHFFTFRDGKIAYYRGAEDTAQTKAVLRG